MGKHEKFELWVSSGTGMCRHQLPCSGTVSIGRGEGNTIRIADPSVSRRHAVIHMGEPPVLEDLTGDVGVFICKNDTSDDDATQRVQFLCRKTAPLNQGDRLAFGAVTVLVQRTKDDSARLPDEDTGVLVDPTMALV